jgi:hypothetical protein
MFDELKDVAYGTPEYDRIRNKPPYIKAQMHHMEVNSHHPEFYENGCKDMDLLDVIEMLSDWYASSSRSMTPFMDGLQMNLKRHKITGMAADWIINTCAKYFDCENKL